MSVIKRIYDYFSYHRNTHNTLVEPNLIDTIPRDVRLLIFSYLSPKDLGACSCVSREWNVLASHDALWAEAIRREVAFGKEAWAKYFGDVGIEPPLPTDIVKILKAPCPYWPTKKVIETHLLVLIPETINRRPLTLTSLGELIKKPLQDSASQ